MDRDLEHDVVSAVDVDVDVIDLDDPAARDPSRTGAKASALAVAAASGLPTLPGFALPPALVDAVSRDCSPDGAGVPPAALRSLRSSWDRLSHAGRDAVIVRSSSVAEDQVDDSMAGRFATVPDVRGWPEVIAAVREVAASLRDAGAAGAAPLAVLVQPMLRAAVGGVLFGLDPVTGREDRLVVSATRGQPERLVSGEVEGTRYELDLRGGVRARRRAPDGGRLSRHALRRLARLAQRTAEVFGGPQDVEWAIDEAGRLWLLQSRPVTTERRGRPTGPVLGRGPVAETFPEPLSRLERELWLEPLRDSLNAALSIVGAVPARQLESSPVVTAVGGFAVVDLDLLGAHRESSFLTRLDPRPAVRRLGAAWRVGRLRSALPRLATDLLDRSDAEAAAVPSPEELSTRQLLGVLYRLRQALVALHTHEALVGMVLRPGVDSQTATSVALRVLAGARQDGLDDAEIVGRYPVVLALVPPRIGGAPRLPDVPGPLQEVDGGDARDEMALLREALRLRARWLQELGAQAAHELGSRLAAQGALPADADIRDLDLAALRAAVLARRPVRPRPSDVDDAAAEALPSAFRLSDTGKVVPVLTGNGSASGAGGGTGSGVVHQGRNPPEGSVLVVPVLDPSIAPVLDRLAGLVAETGDPLAHLAILARQAQVPTVVGLADAREAFPEGCRVEVDGQAGEVRRLDDDGEERSG